jgi:tetratricopeptide (TPR) repeat protein
VLNYQFVIIAIVVLSVFLGYSIFSKGRQRTRNVRVVKEQRAGDARVLSPQEKKLAQQAQSLLAAGEIKTAAQVYDQLGMTREAVHILESGGFIHDAARLLVRMQRPGRAGIMFAKHKMWDKAVECFVNAGMGLEAAKCYVELRNYSAAADLYLKCNRVLEAAECFESSDRLFDAARAYLSIDQTDRAFSCLQRAADQIPDLNDMLLEADMLNLVATKVETHHDKLIRLLSLSGKLLETILSRITSGDIKTAVALYKAASTDLSPMLIANVNYQSAAGRNLAFLFEAAGNPRAAGMVHEQMHAFREAGLSFEAAGDLERAAYCFERSNDTEKAENLRKVLSKQTKTPPVRNQNSSSPDKTVIITDTNARASLASVKKSVKVGHFSLDSASSSSVTKHGTNADKRRVFEQCNLLKGLPHERQRAFWNAGLICQVDSGTLLSDVGHLNDTAYILLTPVELRLSKTGMPDQIGLQESGVAIGFNSLLVDQPEPVSVSVLNATSVFSIKRQELDKILESDGLTAKHLYKAFTTEIMALFPEQTAPEAKAS